MSEDPTPPVDPAERPAAQPPRPGATASAASPRRRLRTIALSLLGGGAALALAVGGVTALTSARGGGSSTAGSPASASPKSSTAPSASASAAPTGPATAPDVDAVLADLVSAGAKGAAAPDTGTDRVDAIMTGALLEEFANDQQELAAFGWTRTGSPQIVSSAVLSSDLTASPAQVVVRACVDVAQVQTLDSAGTPIPTDPTVTPRSLSDFTLLDIGGRWLVADRTYPDNPQC
ncbi:hypothetical protein [Schumannella soli]|uniref:Uncharacterized protein n=1 Tax=Schumannella soli TaxID=2590779 RepID=A0A506Y3B2_9MICO|nr:hypothetical protein [Schumannella soli]TPW76413.1 hypothetical protein FJ657_11620 [Schumannella soli]